jgi:hypothetical protein
MQRTPSANYSATVNRVLYYFRFMGWGFLMFGTFALIHCIRAVSDPNATLNVNRVETSDPHTKLMTTLCVALFPITGLLLAFTPRRFFDKLYAQNLARFREMTGPRPKK